MKKNYLEVMIEVETNYKKKKVTNFILKMLSLIFLITLIYQKTQININKNVFDKEREIDSDQKIYF